MCNVFVAVKDDLDNIFSFVNRLHGSLQQIRFFHYDFVEDVSYLHKQKGIAQWQVATLNVISHFYYSYVKLSPTPA